MTARICCRPGCREPLRPCRDGREVRFCSRDCREWARRRREGCAIAEDARELGPEAPLLETARDRAAREARLLRAIQDGVPRQHLLERFAEWEIQRAETCGVLAVRGNDALPLGVPAP